ncbi:MAG: MauE/DoxX family redox-associated membrane protein [Lentimonas sp.]
MVARLVVAGTFLLAALPKIGDPLAFAQAVAGFQLINGVLAHYVAIILPWFELIVGIGLVVPAIRRASGACISLLLITFIGLHASAWQRGLDISCGCFGTATEPTTNYSLLILRNLLFLIAVIWVMRRDFKSHTRASEIAI